MKLLMWFTLSVIGSLFQTEALQCYQCTYTESEGIAFGEPSCANGKTPDKSLLVDCEDFVGSRSVCLKAFTTETTSTTTTTATTRQCVADSKQPLTCTKEVAMPPGKGYATSCYCYTDGCDPKITED